MTCPHSALFVIACLAVPALLSGCLDDPDLGTSAAAEAPAPVPARIGLDTIAQGLDRPVQLVPYPDRAAHFLVAEMGGTVRTITPAGPEPDPLLDISDRLATDHREQGLLGLALHPDFPDDARLFVTYTATNGTMVLSSFAVAGDGAIDNRTEHPLLFVPQVNPYHNGGHITFGPGGHLFAAFGDGSPQGDPDGNAQNLSNLLGSLIRIDVDNSNGYVVPADNPFVGRPGRDEIWLYGLRNPWRFSFDDTTGDLWIADVGYNGNEEINRIPAAIGGGHNMGWPRWEGSAPFDERRRADGTLLFPVHEYARHDTCASVTGGFVYRGTALPDLVGQYVFADFCSGLIQSLVQDDDGWYARDLVASDLLVAGFGQDHDHELHVLSYTGSAHRIVPPLSVP